VNDNDWLEPLRKKNLALLIFSAACTHAAEIYILAGTGNSPDPEPVAFQLISSTFVNPALDGAFVTFSCAELDSNTNCNSADNPAITFLDTSASPAGYSDVIRFAATDQVEYDFYFPTGALPGCIQTTRCLVSTPER